ncbi:MAG: transporter substrate-binding domain-containing protein, partial [Phycisphaerales bacterium]
MGTTTLGIARFSSLVLLCCGLLLGHAASAAARQPSSEPSSCRVAARPGDELPTLVEFDAEGRMYGFVVELLNAAARESGLSIEQVRMKPGEPVRAAMKAGRVQLIPLMVIDDSTEAFFALSQPLVTTELVAFARWDTPTVRSIGELRGARVVATEADIASAKLIDL